jgi:hypothetical protein
LLFGGGGDVSKKWPGGDADTLKRASDLDSCSSLSDCEEGTRSATPDRSDKGAARSVRWRGPTAWADGGGGEAGRGAGSGCGGRGGVDAAALRQLGMAAAGSVGLVVVYRLFFSYPVQL